MSVRVANRLVFLLACAGVFVAPVLGLAHSAGARIQPLEVQEPLSCEKMLLPSTSARRGKHW